MTDITATVREVLQEALAAGDRVVLSELADRVFETRADVMQTHADYLCRSAILKILKRLAHEQTEDEDSQLSLFGFPSVIAVPLDSEKKGDGYYYKATPKATLKELEAGRNLRVENILRAQAKLDRYDEALDSVRPMLAGTEKTLSQVLTELRDPVLA